MLRFEGDDAKRDTEKRLIAAMMILEFRIAMIAN
jgi:hypothetical protein